MIIQLQDKDTIQLSWISPDTIVGVPVTGFNVYWKNTRSREYKVVKITNTSLYDFTIPNPSPCDMYEFKISAVIDEAGTVLEGNSSQPIQGNFRAGKRLQIVTPCSNYIFLHPLSNTWLGPPAINASSVKVIVEFKPPLIKLTLLFPVSCY